MAQLRAKQIKLTAPGDLLIGGANGNGTVLTQGTAGQVLKVLAGGALAYEKAASADTTFADASFTATNVSAALIEAKKAATDEATRAIAKDTALQTELDATQTGAGLGADGAYTADANTAYLQAATSLKDADTKLDSKLKSVSDKLDALGSGSITNLQNEVDALETAVGVNADGTYKKSTNTLISAATSVLNADELLATAIKAETDRATGVDTALQGELDATQAGAGLSATGAYTADAASNYLKTATTLADADKKLDAQAKLNADAAAAAQKAADDEKTRAMGVEAGIQSELDATQAGAGLSAAGAYVAHTTATYIKDATTLDGADVALDTALKAVDTAYKAADGALQTEVDATQAGAGLSNTGAYVAETDSNYINTATSLKGADKLLDAAIKALDTSTDTRLDALEAKTGVDTAALQAELDAIETGAGLNADGTYTKHTTSNYINDATSLKAADLVLDAAVKAVNDRVTALGAAFNYVGTVAGGATAGAAFDLATLPDGGKDAGDYYKVTTAGYLKIGAAAAFYVNVNDGIIWNKTGGVDIIDNSNSQVLAGANIKVTGSADTGFTVALDGIVPVANGGTGKAALESVTAASNKIVLGAGAANSVVNAFTIDLDTSKVLFKELSGVNNPGASQEGKYLKWTSTGLAYVSAGELGATVAGEEDFTPDTAANATVTLAHTPVGAIAVYINGVKLKKAGFALTGLQVQLNDATNGYGVETGDTVSVSYNYSA